MSAPLLLALPGPGPLAKLLAQALEGELGTLELRSFPDGESYLRILADPRGRTVLLFCSLDRPDPKLLPLLCAADTARELGAARVGLVAPYLAYLRQDRRFRDGEAVTSRSFAALLSRAIDWLVTVDPHLHRYKDLEEIYSVPAVAVHSAALLSRWIAAEVDRPLLIGPDSESAQWVSAVAQGAGAPYQVLKKLRRGDRDVSVSQPQVARWRDHTPVVLDDMASSGRTMIETIRHLRDLGLSPPICIAVHAVFAGQAYEEIRNAGAQRIVTSNTIDHPSNAIDVTPLLSEACRAFL